MISNSVTTKNTTEPSPLVAIIVAAGSGKRFGAQLPKQYMPLAGGCVLDHTIERLFAVSQLEKIILVVAKADNRVSQLHRFNSKKLQIISGGEERAVSVSNAIHWLTGNGYDDNCRVMVHDAARPCVTVSDINKLIAHQLQHLVAAILATPVTDTIKQLTENQQNRQSKIEKTVARNNLRRALTPQIATLGQFNNALEAAQGRWPEITDDASMLEISGEEVHCVEGRSDNIKITHFSDLAMAEFILQRQEEDTQLNSSSVNSNKGEDSVGGNQS